MQKREWARDELRVGSGSKWALPGAGASAGYLWCVSNNVFKTNIWQAQHNSDSRNVTKKCQKV